MHRDDGASSLNRYAQFWKSAKNWKAQLLFSGRCLPIQPQPFLATVANRTAPKSGIGRASGNGKGFMGSDNNRQLRSLRRTHAQPSGVHCVVPAPPLYKLRQCTQLLPSLRLL